MPIPHSKVRNTLRKLWLWGPERREAVKRSKLSSGWFKCDICGRHATKVDIDHIVPVGSTPGARGSGDRTWDAFMKALFVESDGLQAACTECHAQKTKEARNAQKAG